MELLLLAYVFIFGTMVGSFLNVVILRLPVKKDLVWARSACPSCGGQLKWYHNIPLFSFLALRGKCAFCGSRISWRYPLIELLTGLVAIWLFPRAFTPEALGLYLIYFAVACVFICHFFIDLDHHLLLDSLNIYLLLALLPLAALTFHWKHWLFGGLLGFGGPLLVTWIFYKLRGQVGLGGGDIKLFGILGLYLGPTGIMLTIFFSCFIGAAVGLVLIALRRTTKDVPMAFGPYILFVSAFQIFFPEHFHKIQTLLLF